LSNKKSKASVTSPRFAKVILGGVSPRYKQFPIKTICFGAANKNNQSAPKWR